MEIKERERERDRVQRDRQKQMRETVEGGAETQYTNAHKSKQTHR